MKKIILLVILLIVLIGCAKEEIMPIEELPSEITPAQGADIPEPLPGEIKEEPPAVIELPEEEPVQAKPITGETPKEESKSAEESETEIKSPDEPKTTESQNTASIEIKKFEFVPSKLTIKKGTTVIWKNVDDKAHIFRQVGKTFNSPIIKSGDEYDLTFDEEGIFKYTELNYGQRMEIVVE